MGQQPAALKCQWTSQHSTQVLGQKIKLIQDRCLPNPFPYIIQQLLHHPTAILSATSTAAIQTPAKQERQCTHKVTLKLVPVTTVAVQKE
jgi:hypothetical protein